jgi:alpha-1,3-mannosyltransferase
MRVAQVCRIGWPHTGGMEAVVGGLSAALVARGHEVEVITLDRSIVDGSRLSEGCSEGVRYRRLPRVGPRRYPFARGLNHALRGFDLAHIHGLDGLADVAVLGGHGARVGISTHGGYFHTDRHRWVKAVALRTVTRRTLRRADAVWYTSASDRASLAAAGVAGAVVHNGIDLRRFEGVQRTPEVGRWLVYGRVAGHKGLDRLIDILAHVKEGEVEVVGPEAAPGLIRRLRQRASAAGVGERIRFHGAVSDDALRRWISSCELALFPSRFEGFGLTTVELMAAGMPVVASRIPAFEDLVSDGETGWLVDFGDPRRAAQQLAFLRGEDHTAIQAAGTARGRSFSWDRRVDRWEEAYAEVLQ